MKDLIKMTRVCDCYRLWTFEYTDLE